MKKHILGAALIAGIAMGAGAAQAADAAAGKDVFKQCMACHTTEQGKNKVGPSLFGVVDRPAGKVDGFKYSKPMQEKAAVGHPVRRLVRTRIGPLSDARLRPGEWRELTTDEVRALERAVSAGADATDVTDDAAPATGEGTAAADR